MSSCNAYCGIDGRVAWCDNCELSSQESVYVDVDAQDLPASSERPTALCGKGVSL